MPIFILKLPNQCTFVTNPKKPQIPRLRSPGFTVAATRHYRKPGVEGPAVLSPPAGLCHGKLVKVDEGQTGIISERLGNDLEQRVAFYFARSPQPRTCLIESTVAISRMANQLPCSWRHGMKERTQH